MKQHSISKKDILTGKKQFNDLFSYGVFLSGSLIDVIYQDADSFKIAFTVSKKIRGNAKRNKLKRHLREIYRTNKNQFPADKHVAIIAKKVNYNFHDLKTEILKMLKNLN